MATKKGIIITAAILAVISGASFVVWFLPQNHGSSVVVSDYKSELDSVKERHSLIIADTGIKPQWITRQISIPRQLYKPSPNLIIPGYLIDN